MGLSVHVLGAVQVRHEGRSVRLPGQAIVVLAGLALREGDPMSSDRLVDLLWPGLPPRTARVQVQNLVSALRRALRQPQDAADPAPGDSAIRLEPVGYRLLLEPGQLDLQVFRAELRTARRLRAGGHRADAAGHYRRALQCWSGPVCADLDRPALGDLSAALSQTQADAVEEWAELSLPTAAQHDDWDGGGLVVQLQRALAAHPFRERMRGQLIRALWATGRRAEALQCYQDGRRRLAEELGIDPAPALQRLHQDLLRDGAPAADEPVPALPG